MRVIIAKPPGGAFKYITRGFINAFQSIGVDARYWNGSLTELADFKPDLYIGASAFRFEVPDRFRTRMKLAIHVNPYFEGKLDIVHGNDINEPKNAIDWVVKQKPDAVYGYGYKDERKYWSNWTTKHGIKFVEMPTAGDAVLYYPDVDESHFHDVVYLGGRWPFKAHKLDSWLMPIINKFDVKIKGWGGWQGVKGYLGVLDDNDSGRIFLSSSKICPCISEPHTSIYGIDIPERYFKAALCGSLPISDLVPGFEKYVPASDLVLAKNPTEYSQLISEYLENDEKRIERARNIRKIILNNHTYHHRMMNLCNVLGYNEAVEKFSEKIKTLQ